MFEPIDDDYGNNAMEGYVTEERAKELFLAGAQAMREMLARFVAVDSPVIAESIRANWVPSWGKDPGKFEGDLPRDCWDC